MSEVSQRPFDPVSVDVENTTMAQARASNPDVCAWVSANAGAGKTHVLKMRVLRLLFAGVQPSRILCLTYTKAAASEMASRVFEDLTEWAIADDIDLDRRLTELTGKTPNADQRNTARQLFAKAIETPGGLKVQTIHGFCEQILQRFPLEAGLRPGFSTLDDSGGRELIGEALSTTLSQAAERSGTVAQALQKMIVYAADERFSDLVEQAARSREWLTGIAALDAQSHVTDNLDLVDVYYRQQFGIGADQTSDSLEQEIAGLLDDATIETAERVLAASQGKTDNAQAEALANVRKAKAPDVRAAAMQAVCLTKTLSAKADRSFISAAIQRDEPGLFETLSIARDRCERLTEQIATLRAIDATRALLEIATDMSQRFRRAKQHQGALDFDDLIARTVDLLEAGDAARWVLFKLDGGIEHILVDEAQDTSPPQWAIVAKMAEPFFDGEGTADRPRTVFAVGDEKQSIYSFQGAAPRLFGERGHQFAKRAEEGHIPFEHIPLNLSFRTVQPILTAVDTVFEDTQRTPGLSYTNAQVKHAAFRAGQAGRVELWPLEVPDDGEDAAPFDPLADRAERSAITKLCDRIGETIARWLREQRRLEAIGKIISPGDIMILVRNRRPVAAPMIAALKARGIPVAGADRMVLTDQLVVQDLISLGDFLTLPEDDLALANVLKSPMFDYSDEHLMVIAPGRKGSLWSAMIKAAKSDDAHADAVAVLKAWRSEADFLPPFEFFSNLLNTASHLASDATYRQRMMRRLGPDAGDPLDEFLEAALRYDDEAAPSLQGFIGWLRATELQIKRDMDSSRDEVRLMTVHGAKGLEAPIVFLPDTTSDPTGRETSSLLRLGGPDEENKALQLPLETQIWSMPLQKCEPDLVEAAKADRKAKAGAEANRLLYVAMTRARDELYICGNQPWNRNAKKPRKLPEKSWYSIIAEGLDGLLSAPDADGIRRLVARQETETTSLPAPIERTPPPEPLPIWTRTRVASEPRLQIPIAPSRLAPLEQDDFGDPIDRAADTKDDQGDKKEQQLPARTPPAPSPKTLAHDNRFLRGNVTHALLQHLPNLPADTWEAAARAFVDQRGGGLDQRVRTSIVAETLAVLKTPAFQDAFADGSRAEVAIAAEIPNPTVGGPALKIAGSIDRLAVNDHNVLIIDFKTNRPPPQTVDQVPSAYILQLAAYRLAIGQIFPNQSVDAALLWTDGARLMPIPPDQLDSAERDLWTPGGPALDALGGQT